MAAGRGYRVTRFRPGFLQYRNYVGVNFDGSTTYLTRGAGLTGAADGNEACGSFWIRMGNDGTSLPILFAPGNNLEIRRLSTNTLNFSFRNISGIQLSFTTSLNSLTVASGWVHVLWSFNITTGEYFVYLDDADDLASSSTTGGPFDFTHSDWYVGWNGALSYGDFDLAEFWMALGSSLDLSVEANRRKFITASGSPAYLGADGTQPGITPIIYLSGAVDDWHTNKGTGGGFTENGTLTETDFP